MRKSRIKDKYRSRRWEVGKSLLRLGNIAGSVLLFSQAISEKPFDFGIAFLGLLLTIWLYVTALAFMKDVERD